jgi:chromate reductase, NAD(P)H dehydrogenase (quinone)
MNTKTIRIIGISGSLRPDSSATKILKEAGALFPADVIFDIYAQLEAIPAFNDSNIIPPVVNHFIELITNADGILFCIPEYAFGVPGALKNALDWTVSSTAFTDKPVALITAASSGDKAHAALSLTLSALGTKMPAGSSLLIPFIRTKINAEGKITDGALLNIIQLTVDTLLQTIVDK